MTLLALAVAGSARLPINANAEGTGSEPQRADRADLSLASVTKPGWIDVAQPFQTFDLANAEFGNLPLAYQVRRQAKGPERQDVLRYGSLGAETPYLDLTITRLGAAPSPAPKFFVAMARLAADKGLAVVRSSLPTTTGTRFGPVSIGDLSLARVSTVYPCLGFRLDRDGTASHPVDIAGIACGTSGKAMERNALACMLDGIGLVSAGDDTALRDFFVAAERRQDQECINARPLAAGSQTTKPNGTTISASRLKHHSKMRSALTILLQNSERTSAARPAR